jgi:hypothetical protein
MYRGSRLAASFLLFLTGSAVIALAAFVVPSAIGPDGPWLVAVAAFAFGIAHFTALAGVARGRRWGRDVAVTLAQAGGGISIAMIVALVLGANPAAPAGSAGSDVATTAGVAAWMAGLYALLGVAAGRVRFTGWSRRSAWWPAPLLRVEVS